MHTRHGLRFLTHCIDRQLVTQIRCSQETKFSLLKYSIHRTFVKAENVNTGCGEKFIVRVSYSSSRNVLEEFLGSWLITIWTTLKRYHSNHSLWSRLPYFLTYTERATRYDASSSFLKNLPYVILAWQRKHHSSWLPPAYNKITQYELLFSRGLISSSFQLQAYLIFTKDIQPSSAIFR